MDVVPYMPGDPMLIDRIVCELKSQGIFDSFRKECIADVDTKPAYQNLRQRVEGSVSGFLRKQKWNPEMNKNHVREMLRKNIYESGFLETGVERIVDQVVNPKMNSVFLPKVTEVVYKYLGIEKPTDTKENLTITTENLLPKDLEAVSPVSDKKDDKLDDSQNIDDKMEEDESPPFEPIDDNILQEENSVDSHISGFSGLISHDSNQSDSQKQIQIDSESQMSKHSNDVFFATEQKMEISEDSRQDSNSKNFEIEASNSNSAKIENKKEDKKSDKKEEKKDDKKEERKSDKKEDRKDEKRDDKKDDRKKDRSREKKDDRRDRKDSKTSSKDRDKSRDKKDTSKKSNDKYKSKYVSSSREKISSTRSKDKCDSKDRSKDKKDTKHVDRSKSSSHSKSDRHRKSSSSSSHQTKDKKDKKHTKDDHYSSKHKTSSDRRSTDRDSNDGSGLKSSSSSYCESNSSSQTSTTQTSKTQDSTSNSNDSGNSDSVETKHPVTSTLDSKETHLDKKEFKLIKPKIASNIHEARRIIKIRKQLKQIEKQSSIALSAIDEKIQSDIEIKKDDELPIASLPRISVSMASWDALEAKMNENINFDSYCEPEEKSEESQLLEPIEELNCFSNDSITEDEVTLKKVEESVNSCMNDIKLLQTKMELSICNNIMSNQKENKENKRIGLKRKLLEVDSFKKIKNNNNLIGVNANEDKFSLPLSPAESDASGDRKVDNEIESPIDGKTKKPNTKRQRYSSDDLYKPRPLITRSSRRRPANLD